MATFKLSNNTNINVETPNICPHCHVANEPEHFAHKHDDKSSTFLSIWKCKYHKCGRWFAVSHHRESGQWTIERYLNGLPKGPNWPKPILDLKDGKSLGTESEQDSKFIKDLFAKFGGGDAWP